MKKIQILFLLFFLPMLVTAQTYSVGDTIRGGIVFFIAENGDSMLICGRNDAIQYSNWADAKTRCENFFSIYGNQMHRGWRMPTAAEMKIIRSNRELINNLIEKAGGIPLDSDVGAYYWTSTEGEYTSQAWLQPLGFDLPVLMNKESNSFNARAVQTIYLK